MPKLSPEEFSAIIEKHSQIAEYDVVTNLLQTIPEDCDPEMIDKMVKENQSMFSLPLLHFLLFPERSINIA